MRKDKWESNVSSLSSSNTILSILWSLRSWEFKNKKIKNDNLNISYIHLYKVNFKYESTEWDRNKQLWLVYRKIVEVSNS